MKVEWTSPEDIAGEELIAAVRAAIAVPMGPGLKYLNATSRKVMIDVATRGAIQAMVGYLKVHIDDYVKPSREAEDLHTDSGVPVRAAP